MKKLLLLCLPLVLLFACGDKGHKTDLVFDKAQTGLHIVSVTDTFNQFKPTYLVRVMLKNDGKDKAENFLVTAKYKNESGDITAENNGGAGKTIAPGESLLIVIPNDFTYSTKASLPYKVDVSVKSMF